MTNARDKANIPVLNFSSKGIDDNATSTAITISSLGLVGIGTTSPSHELEIHSTSPTIEWSDSDNNYISQITQSGSGFFITSDINGLGSSSMRFRVNGNTERMRLTATGLGIGTTSPSQTLHVLNGTSSGGLIQYDGQSNAEFGLRIQSNISGGNFESDFANGTTALLDLFANSSTTSGGDLLVARTQSSTPVLLVKGNGRVGIGTTSPTSLLTVAGILNATNGNFGSNVSSQGTLNLSNNGAEQLEFFTGVSSGLSQIQAFNRNDSTYDSLDFISLDTRFKISGTEKARIDTSGNLLVGKTSTGVTGTGVVLRNSGELFVTKEGDMVNLNRLNSDGIIQYFRKDGSIIGNIGVDNSDNLFISGNSSHAGFEFGSSSIVAYKSGTSPDNAINLGGGAQRFADLYLGGGVFLGGTGTANKLDDYEEGTWTPVFSSGTGGYNGSALSITTATYTKIGNQVNLYCSFAVTGGSSISVGDSLAFTGQPFTPATPFTQRMGVGSSNQSIGSNSVAVGIICATSTDPGTMRFVVSQVNGSVSATVQTHFNMKYPT